MAHLDCSCQELLLTFLQSGDSLPRIPDSECCGSGFLLVFFFEMNFACKYCIVLVKFYSYLLRWFYKELPWQVVPSCRWHNIVGVFLIDIRSEPNSLNTGLWFVVLDGPD
jgi:hypothetical protein